MYIYYQFSYRVSQFKCSSFVYRFKLARLDLDIFDGLAVAVRKSDGSPVLLLAVEVKLLHFAVLDHYHIVHQSLLQQSRQDVRTTPESATVMSVALGRCVPRDSPLIRVHRF